MPNSHRTRTWLSALCVLSCTSENAPTDETLANANTSGGASSSSAAPLPSNSASGTPAEHTAATDSAGGPSAAQTTVATANTEPTTPISGAASSAAVVASTSSPVATVPVATTAVTALPTASGAGGETSAPDLPDTSNEETLAPDRDAGLSQPPAEPKDAAPSATTPITVFIAGDSTVSTYRDTESTTDQAGWGQMFQALLADSAQVDNRAVGGRTARSYIDGGFLDDIADDIAMGDALLVQFGTNDGNRTATYELNGETIPYYLEPATDFKTYLSKYIEFSQAKAATLIFVTPPPRNSAYCTGGNGTGGHAQAMRELGADEGIVVADLNTRSVDYLKSICPSPTPEDFFLLRADGSVDGTHFQENGARNLARFVAEEIAASGAPLAAYVR